MSTHATTDATTAGAQPLTTQPQDAVVDETDQDEGVDFPMLLCPRDGQILELEDKIDQGHGRYECPRCRNIWNAWEVFNG